MYSISSADIDRREEMSKIKSKRKSWLFIILFIIFLLIGITIYQNLVLKNTFYTVEYTNLPDGFSDYRIAQVSDLHNAEFGKNNSQLIKSLRTYKPAIITLTGDLIDSSRTNIEVALNFVEQAVEIAPCYFVTGNHEAWIGEKYLELEEGLINLGVTVLRNQKVTLENKDDSIALIGLDDPDYSQREFYLQDSVIHENLEEMGIDKNKFTILLSHRPELFDSYCKHSIELVLSGHAHGGQFRIPFLGGLVAPNQGLFPKYTSGMYAEDNTKMIVSRGIGNSIIPVRINNQPEIVYVDLVKK